MQQRISTALTKPLVIFFPQNLMSHNLRCIELAKRIRTAYSIRFVSCRRYQHFILEAGFDVIDNDANSMQEILLSAGNFDFGWIQYDYLTQTMRQQISIIEKHKPILVVGDANLSLRMAAEVSGVTYVALQNNYLSRHYADIRPVPHTHRAMAFKNLMSESNWIRLVSTVEKIVLRAVHKPFRLLRNKYGLKKCYSLLDEFEGDYTMYLDNEYLFPLKQIKPNAAVIGPLMHCSNQAEDVILSWLQQCKNRKTIYISMGSSGNKKHIDFIRDKRFAMYNIVVSGDPNLGADNVISQEFINFDAIAQHVDLVICHGGNGTLYQAFSNGIPVIAIPSIFEQEWNIHRVLKLKLGDVFFTSETYDILVQKIENQIIRKNTKELAEIQQQLNSSNYYNVEELFKRIIQKQTLVGS